MSLARRPSLQATVAIWPSVRSRVYDVSEVRHYSVGSFSVLLLSRKEKEEKQSCCSYRRPALCLFVVWCSGLAFFLAHQIDPFASRHYCETPALPLRRKYRISVRSKGYVVTLFGQNSIDNRHCGLDKSSRERDLAVLRVANLQCRNKGYLFLNTHVYDWRQILKCNLIDRTLLSASWTGAKKFLQEVSNEKVCGR